MAGRDRGKSSGLSMQARLAVLTASALVLMVLTQLLVQRLVIFPSFLALERSEAEESLERSFRAIEREVHHLDSQCRDWASWDDTYEFVESRSPAYIESNLDLSTFVNSRLSVGVIVDPGGAVIWHQAVDVAAEQVVEMTVLPTDRFPPDHPLLDLGAGDLPLSQRTARGVILTADGPFLVAARPILTTGNEGPARGTLILGRRLTDPYVALLSEQIRVEFTVTPVNRVRREDLRELEAAAAGGREIVVTTLPTQEVMVRRLLRDVSGEPALVINTVIPGDAAIQGLEAARYATALSVIAGIGIVLVVLLGLTQAVVQPLLVLTRHVRRIERSGDLSARLALGRRDEVGVLADAFDRMVARVEAQTDDLARMNRELELLATLDGLTGVANRRQYDEQIVLEWRRAQRGGTPLAVVLCDVDWFKRYNDTYGHAAGDECLKAVARAIQGTARRAGDLVARYGGEEFAMVLADTPIEGAQIVAENARLAVEQLAVDHSASPIGRVTLSLGVAATIPERGVELSLLVEAADQALYASKAAGRNRVSLAPQPPRQLDPSPGDGE